MTAWRDFKNAIDQHIHFPDGEAEAQIREVTSAMLCNQEEVEPRVPDCRPVFFQLPQTATEAEGTLNAPALQSPGRRWGHIYRQQALRRRRCNISSRRVGFGFCLKEIFLNSKTNTCLLKIKSIKEYYMENKSPFPRGTCYWAGVSFQTFLHM